MKFRFLLPSVFFLFCGLISHAQVYEMFYQGFETGESQNYTVTPAANGTVGTTLYASGSRSLTLTQSTTGSVELLLDTLDFRTQTTLRYVSIEFNHICDAVASSSSEIKRCRLWYKRGNQTDWQPFQSMNYDKPNSSGSDFDLIGGFNKDSYGDWSQTPSNDLWKVERFNLNNLLGPDVANNERFLLIKFELAQHTSTTTPIGHWWIDNLQIKASASLMVRPSIEMTLYPDGLYHPSSRGARIELKATTTVGAGINPDSVYLFYRVGSDPTPIRLPMPPTGVTNTYGAVIPFYGYDTSMYFYCVARDATGNANQVTFPMMANSWVEYKCVRGVEQPGILTPVFTGTGQTSNFPFPAYCNNRSQWVYDSALMASAGYGPGAITSLKFTTAAHTNAVTRQRFQIKMGNVPTDFHPDMAILGTHAFETSYMRVVYDGPFSIYEANADVSQVINLQDTFFYAGKDLLFLVTYNASSDDIPATSIKTIPSIAGKESIWLSGYESFQGSPFTSTSGTYDYGTEATTYRPAMVITQHANLPLFYDMGFDTVRTSSTYGLVTPNRDVAMTPGDHSVKVKLKNFGVMTANAIQISYSIDNTINNTYNWSGSLAGGAVQTVTLNTNVPLAPGFHTIKVWVEDTLTASGQQYRDHEPYNDTIFSEFIVCDGAFSGVRNIGGPSADYNTIEEFLFAVSRCGLGDSLVVKLAPGEYSPFTMPAISGLSANHYIVFEPQSGTVTFFADTTTTSSSIVNLGNVDNIRFRNINFVRYNGALTDMVTLGMTSHNCYFLNCQFIDSLDNPAADMRISAMINSGFSNGLYVDGCTFYGGNVGVDVKGQAPDILSSNCSVKNSVFYNQTENGIKVQNQNNVIIEGNELYDVMSSSSYVLYVNECYGTSRVMANKIYTSHGAGAVAVNNAIGTSAHHFLMANNMIVSMDDGTAAQLRNPLNVMQAQWADIVYNSVKMVAAANRNNVAAASFGGSGTLQNSRFVNNIVVSLDNNCYALNYTPGTETSNTVGHNVYYSVGATLNRKSGASYPNISAWQLAEPSDTVSISVNPNFLNGSLVDLRTYNRLVKGIGIPIATVTTDMFDTLRSTTAPCPGAFEFVSLPYDFEPEALTSPEASVCYMPSQVELKVRIRNSGVNAYTGSGLTLNYQVNNGPENTVNITDPIPAEDTITVNTGVMLSLPANGTQDAVYQIMVRVYYAADPNQTNDQNTFTVISRYHPAKPANILDSVNYATPATITPVTGIESWSVYDNTSAAHRNSSIYWYSDTNDAAPFYVGPTLVTDSLRADTNIYFRQRRSQAIVRITQVEITKSTSTTGATPSMPYWINNSRKLALQLTNVGDERAYLAGDSIVTVSPSSGMHNKIYVFADDAYIEPGQSLVVQYTNGNSLNPAATVHTGFSFNVNSSAKLGILYKRNGVLEDAVAINAVTTENVWSSLSIPSYIWVGSGVTLTPNTTAGIYRTGFIGNNTDWAVATTSNPMFLNTIDPEWIRYSYNGCEGRFATATILLIQPPLADISISEPVLPEPSCGMGMEDVTVTVHNYGIQPVTGLVLNYTAGGDTVTEPVPGTLPANGALTYTFTTQLNMNFGQDSTVTVKVWADSVANEHSTANDTNSATTVSYYTPVAPASIATRMVPYAGSDTITLPEVAGVVPVWYDYSGNAVDTGYTSISEILYVGGTRGVRYMTVNSHVGQVGGASTSNTPTSYPSPYQPNKKYAKQQFIYSASELRAAGLTAGYIGAIAFDLDSIYGDSTSLTFTNYFISMGQTSDTIFSSKTDWKSVQQVYHRSPMTIHRSDCHNWMSHTLDTPFYWNGVSSVVVQLVHEKNTAYTSGVQSHYTAKNNTTLHKADNSALSPSTMDFSGTGDSKGNNRPNIRFSNIVYGCTSPITPYTVQMTNIPPVDMAVLWPDGMDTIDFNSCGNSQLYVNVRNQGAATADNTVLYYYFDALPVDSTIVTNSIASGATENVMFMNRYLAPGRHVVTVVVSAPGDEITSNDTVSLAFMVRFCGGTYTIAADGGDYHSFGEAIDTLNVAGIEGPVVFNVAEDTYTEQVRMTSIQGSSNTNTITFMGTGDNVLLTAATTQNTNYVMFLDSVSNVRLSNFRIEARPTSNSANYANALVMRKGGNITVDNCTIRVKGTINNASASCVIIQDGISGLTFNSNVIDSGYYSIKSSGADMDFFDIILNNNIIKNFYSQGISLRGVTNVDITSNQISAGVNITGRGLKGIGLGQSVGNIVIQKNNINLIDEKNGGKLGIMLTGINCSASNPAFVVNNMISCSGTGTSGLSSQKPCGIWIDSLSANITVLYNSIRVNCGPYANASYSDASYSFFAGASTTGIQVQNNIFSNVSKGYAYYVAAAGAVTISNYNAYYTVSERPFAWGSNTTLANLSALQAANTNDANSLFEEPYFAADNDLHLVMTNFATKALFIGDVTEDIDGRPRFEIPAPTIGAHEMGMFTHDMAVVRIIEPTWPSNINNPTHIESDSVRVIAQFYNNGLSVETSAQWYAYIEGQPSSTPKALGTFNPSQIKTDTVMLPTFLGMIDTAVVHVVVTLPNDTALSDNERTSMFYLAPAFNLKAKSMSTDHVGCNMQDVVVSITVKNEGFKDFAAGTPVRIGYSPTITNPANISISTLTPPVEESVTLPSNLLTGQEVTIPFTTHANLYPTDTAVDLKVRIRGWCKYDYDVSPENDTTSIPSSLTVDSWYTPDAPIGHDTIFPYGTWGEVKAEQVNHRPIRWYRDSTAAPFFPLDTNHNIINNYNTSCTWRSTVPPQFLRQNTPQFFHDSTYYLQCTSLKGCLSRFSEVHVHVDNLKQNDMAFEEMYAPVGGRVYMENDTVRVRIANYGTRAQNNVPITYELKQGSSVLQTVTEMCPVAIPAGDTYDYTFDSLLAIPDPTLGKNYVISVWTDLATDESRRNDTMRFARTFRTLPESTYAPTGSGNPSFDVTRVSFNEIDLVMPPLGRGLSNMAAYNSPEYPVVHVTKGTVDSLIVEVTPLDATSQSVRCKIWTYIDFDRNGVFTNNERLVSGETFYDNQAFATQIAIANDASYGYMRMRIAVGTQASFPDTTDNPNSGIPSNKDGHTLDFLLFVDAEPLATDIAVTQIVAPRSYLIRDDAPKVISFRVANKGNSAINNPQFSYMFVGDTIDSTAVGTVNYPGTILPGQSVVVSLPAHTFPLGTSTLTIRSTLEGDLNPENDLLVYEYHRFHVITLPLTDDFEVDNQHWYAPTGYNDFSHNYWERGVPNKTAISTAHSDSIAWVTDLTSNIVTGKRGSVSYLYSPIIENSQIHPDTISFYLRRNLGSNGSSVTLEFFNFEGRWVKLNVDSTTNWYNNVDDGCFDGNTSGTGYDHYWVSSGTLTGDFNEHLQFRLVYSTPIGNSTSAAFGGGCALDDFYISRARRSVDPGLIAITQPVSPRYGQTIYPEVVVKNYGTDTLRNLSVGYTRFGRHLSDESTFSNLCIPPDSTDTLLMSTPFIITRDFPEEFTIRAFTYHPEDLYNDNDTIEQLFTLTPLDNDIGAYSFLYPLDHVIAGDTGVYVTMRIRNMGFSPISHATASYIVNGTDRVDEEIDFEELLGGRPLESLEYFNYTFHQRIRANMGWMKLVGIIKSEQNDYIYNDTVSKRVEGITSVTDIAAASVIVDTSSYSEVRIELLIENRGARGANDFVVGYYIDNDPINTLRTEYYTRPMPIPSLGMGFHTFNMPLPPRPAGYHNVTGFVHIDGDNDPTNDTTTELATQYLDIELVKVIIEENSAPDCRVIMQLRNNGNVSLLAGSLQLKANINGTSISYSTTRRIEPGQIAHVIMERRIPKSPERVYTGTGTLMLGSDANPGNNQTSLIEVINYFDPTGVPVVEKNELLLDQNYPNPFTGRTTVPFVLPTPATVHFFVVDAMGHIVSSFDRFYEEGAQTIELNMDSYPAGIYYYGIEVNGERRMKKMIMR